MRIPSDPPIFPAVPRSWYHVCESRCLRGRPFGFELGGLSYVAYRPEGGQATVLGGRCVHLGAPLAKGTVCGHRLVCPLHGWEYGPDGTCERIPAEDEIPAFARQRSYPTVERGGQVFFFNHEEPLFPLAFFPEMEPEQLVAARPFELPVESAWYFVGANGFDLQHFRMAHDRILFSPPEVKDLSPYARQIVATFEVAGKSLPDRLIRSFAGPQVKMEVTSWCGTMVWVRAQFARTTSYGLFNVLPLSAHRTLGRVVVWIRRSRSKVGQAVYDPLNAAIRRVFIRNFLQSDLPRTVGLRYRPEKLIAADDIMADYFQWLAKATSPSTRESL